MPDFAFAIKAESNRFKGIVHFTSLLSSDDSGQWSKALLSQVNAQHMRLAGQSRAQHLCHVPTTSRAGDAFQLLAQGEANTKPKFLQAGKV